MSSRESGRGAKRSHDGTARRRVSGHKRDLPPHKRGAARAAMPVLASFPDRYVPRAAQREVLGKVESALKSGYRNILLCVPTGVGKSHIGVAVAKHLGTSFVVTAQKILQDQYVRDFGFILPMKGKTNFPCLALYDPKERTYKSAKMDPDLSCYFGRCSWEAYDENGKKKIAYCKHKPPLSGFVVRNRGAETEVVSKARGKCHYYNQKFRALMATHAIFNYSSYFQTRLFPGGAAEYLRRDCLVADEAHEIEDQIIGYIGFDIRPSYMRDAGFRFKSFVTNTVEGVLELLEILHDTYRQMIHQMESEQLDTSILRKFRKRNEKIYMTIGAIKKDRNNFAVQEDMGFNGDVSGVSIKPIEIDKYTERFFDSPHQLFMSATIHKGRFCKTMGIPESKCAFIEVGRSPFPARSRRITFHDVRWLNRNSTKEDYGAVYGKAASIIKRYAGKKGLVLTTTRDQCQAVRDAAGPRIVIAHEGVEGGREAVLKAHARSRKPNVLASPSCWYGVDLKDDLSRFQIVIKTPYPSLADKRTKIKLERDPDWYRYATLVKLLQGFGRSVRGEGDHCDTHVLDGNASSLLKRHKDMVPKAYHDVLGWK